MTRLDYGVKWNHALEGDATSLSDEVKIDIAVEALHQPPGTWWTGDTPVATHERRS